MRTSQPHLKILCPCRLCDRGLRKEKHVTTVLQHLHPEKGYGRDPKNFGKSKGYDCDESDTEWEEHIIRTYGEIAAANARDDKPLPSQDDFDLIEAVSGAFQMYDALVGKQFAEENMHNVDEDVGAGPADPMGNQDTHSTQRSESPLQHPDDGEHEAAYNADEHLPPQGENQKERQNPEESDDDDIGEVRNEFRSEGGSGDEGGHRWNAGEANPMSTEEAFLRDSATTPLFQGSRVSMLSAVILIINCLRMHGASSALTNELFTLLSKVILPQVNISEEKYIRSSASHISSGSSSLARG
ncbi:hypothetical protein M758_UG229900 [Ceratodon purpureus]|nr:hypothetical protein M758_UG229900 [Ceratodon purpureus]